MKTLKASADYELRRLLRNWRAECDSAALYAAFARLERDPRQSRVYQKLAGAERRHAAFWEERLLRPGQGIVESTRIQQFEPGSATLCHVRRCGQDRANPFRRLIA